MSNIDLYDNYVQNYYNCINRLISLYSICQNTLNMRQNMLYQYVYDPGSIERHFAIRFFYKKFPVKMSLKIPAI